MKIRFFIENDFKLSPSQKASLKDSKKKVKKIQSVESLMGQLDTLKNHLVHIVFSSNQRIRSLNKSYRHKDDFTDVLTFVYEKGGQKSLPKFYKKSLPHGEVYISVETAERQSSLHRVSLSDELCLLSVHGILHVLGFDHERSEKDRQLMQAQESDLLRHIGLAYVSPLTS